MWHYLRDLAVRHNVPNKKIKTITWIHFHQWCKQICLDNGFSQQYKQIFKDNNSTEEVLGVDLIDVVQQAIKQNQDFIVKYDAILVDEGQDFNLDWWNILRQVLNPCGEMLLVADETQDVYQRAKNWTEEKMKSAGFNGPWLKLKTCYRTPPTLIKYLKDYARQYLKNSIINFPDPESEYQRQLEKWPVQMRWLQVNNQSNITEGNYITVVCSAPQLEAFGKSWPNFENIG